MDLRVSFIIAFVKEKSQLDMIYFIMVTKTDTCMLLKPPTLTVNIFDSYVYFHYAARSIHLHMFICSPKERRVAVNQYKAFRGISFIQQ